MKIKSALKQSIIGAWFAAVLSFGALALAVKLPNAGTFAFLAFTLLFLLGDVVNIFLIKRRAGKDSRYLDEKIN